jgi:hypothetical protein
MTQQIVKDSVTSNEHPTHLAGYCFWFPGELCNRGLEEFMNCPSCRREIPENWSGNCVMCTLFGPDRNLERKDLQRINDNRILNVYINDEFLAKVGGLYD